MNTDAITIDVYDRYSKKLIKGITQVDPSNQTVPILKTIEINENCIRMQIKRQYLNKFVAF
jgi:hypothetical protein